MCTSGPPCCREDGLVNGGGEVLPTEDESRAGTTESFVGGGGGDVRMGHGRRMHSTGDETCDVSHVEDVDSSHLVGDLAHADEVPQAGIGAAATDDGLWLFAQGNGFELVVVDEFGVFADLVEGGPVKLAAEAEAMTVGEVAAMS